MRAHGRLLPAHEAGVMHPKLATLARTGRDQLLVDSGVKLPANAIHRHELRQGVKAAWRWVPPGAHAEATACTLGKLFRRRLPDIDIRRHHWVRGHCCNAAASRSHGRDYTRKSVLEESPHHQSSQTRAPCGWWLGGL